MTIGQAIAVALLAAACASGPAPAPVERLAPARDRAIIFPTWAIDKLGPGIGFTRVRLRVCRDRAGVPDRVVLLGDEPWPELEAYYRSAVSAWRYPPKIIAGTAVPVCEPVAFKYVIDDGIVGGPTSPELIGNLGVLEAPPHLIGLVRKEGWTSFDAVLTVCATAAGDATSVTLEIPHDVPALEASYQRQLQGIRWTPPADLPPDAAGKPFCKTVVIHYKFRR